MVFELLSLVLDLGTLASGLGLGAVWRRPFFFFFCSLDFAFWAREVVFVWFVSYECECEEARQEAVRAGGEYVTA